MSAVATAPSRPSGGPSLVTQARWAVSDTLMIAKRNLLVWIRVPAYLMFTVIQPVMFVLLFVYVFGGAIPVSTPGGYVNFLIPGITAQTAAFASFATAIALAQELKKGVIDRLRSMPMARSAVLTGRLAADTVRMVVTILIIVGVGYAVGAPSKHTLARDSGGDAANRAGGARETSQFTQQVAAVAFALGVVRHHALTPAPRARR